MMNCLFLNPLGMVGVAIFSSGIHVLFSQVVCIYVALIFYCLLSAYMFKRILLAVFNFADTVILEISNFLLYLYLVGSVVLKQPVKV
jgi:hypothetical protein